MQIPLLSGVYTDSIGNVRQSYPVNLVPVPKQSGVSAGYFRAADGIVPSGAVSGAGRVDRGGISWPDGSTNNTKVLRVMGDTVYEVIANLSGLIVVPIGVLTGAGSTSQAIMDYGFDHCAVCVDGRLYMVNRGLSSVTQVTDPDLGACRDVVFIDGYYVFTDGEFIGVTELGDPFTINPLKYGSAEIDPDPILGLFKVRNELAALGMHSIEFFDNVGGSGFPFQRIEGAQIQKGVAGTHSACNFMDTLAFVGAGRNEPFSVYLANGGTATRISTQEIDTIINADGGIREALVEARVDRGHQWLMIHLSDRCLVYDGAASAVMQQPVWFYLTSSASGFEQYRAKNHVWGFNRWIVGDPTSAAGGLGLLTDTLASHYGATVRHELQTLMAYNESRGAIVHSLELVSTTYGAGTVNTSQSVDGINWSANVPSSTAKRIQWRRTGSIREWRIQRFQWDSNTRIVPMRLEAVIEPLAY